MARVIHRLAAHQEGPVLPGALRHTLEDLIPGEVEALEQALRAPPPTSIRIHPARAGAPRGSAIPWCATGRYLPERPVFTLDPALHAGAYYVQEAASMLLEQAFIATGLMQHDIAAMDLCAAPGGKSTHLRSLMTPGSLLVANEVDPKRRSVLAENLWKWGMPNVTITGSPAQDFSMLPGTFDLVLVDAPCSGEGMFRKDPFARRQWNTDLVRSCAATQSAILPHAWQALRPGGVLIYSTCTWETAENEGQLMPLVRRGAISIPIGADPGWGIRPSAVQGIHALRCYPHLLLGDGFFLAALRKPGTWEPQPQARHVPTRGSPAECWTSWMHGSCDPAWFDHQGVWHIVDARHAATMEALHTRLRVHAPGIPVAMRKGNAWRPHPALALNALLRDDAFPNIPLTGPEALHYLRGQALRTGTAHGTALVSYNGLPLGWVQGAGTRWNNGWPALWRIRMPAC